MRLVHWVFCYLLWFSSFSSVHFYLQQYECKLQNIKKRKVDIQVSVDGVKVCLKKKKRKVMKSYLQHFFSVIIVPLMLAFPAATDNLS